MENRRLHSVSSSTELKLLSLRDSFSGFWTAERHFMSWLAKMEALYKPIWGTAGIFEAIKASTYNIVKNPSLILSVSEQWCSETNTFVFPWGEATVTLEDVMLLLGFSVLGSPVFAPLESSEMREAVERLEKVRQDCIRKTRDKGRVSLRTWSSIFLGRGDQMEHEAFLVLWLSLFVFPSTSRRSVSKHVISIAVRLARGERIALAPAVLAGIYRDLGPLSDLARGKCCGEKVHVKSLMKLVQVWTWERFKNIRPQAREIPKGEPRIAQWDSLQQKSKNVRLNFDDFEWRPYTEPLKNWSPFRFYVEEAMWLTVDDSLDDEFVSFARCVRVSQLVGDGFLQGYYPNRVKRQFGLTQDLPESVTNRTYFTEQEAWNHYSRSLAGLKLYIPSRLDRSSVTERYQKLWMRSVSEFYSSEEAQKDSTEALHLKKTVDHYDDDDLDVSPKVLPLSKVVQKLEEGFPAKLRRSRPSRPARKYYEQACEYDDDNSLMDEEDDSMTIAQRIRSGKKYYSDEEETGRDDSRSLGQRRRKFLVADSDDSDACQKLSSVKMEQRSEEDEESANKAQKTRQLCDDDAVSVSNPEKKTMVHDCTKEAEYLHHEDGEKQRLNDDCERWKQRKLAIEELGMNLEARMDKMLKTLAMIRKWKTSRNLKKNGVCA